MAPPDYPAPRQRLNYRQHGEVLAAAGLLALLVGCVEYDAGDG